MGLINYKNVLFVFLVTIVILTIIIIILYNCKKEKFDLGNSIDNIVDNALGSVSGTIDGLDDNVSVIDIETNNAPIYINTGKDLQGFDSGKYQHTIKIGSGGIIPPYDNLNATTTKPATAIPATATSATATSATAIPATATPATASAGFTLPPTFTLSPATAGAGTVWDTGIVWDTSGTSGNYIPGEQPVNRATYKPTGNPPCINCGKLRNYVAGSDTCNCNSEDRCANCPACKWCNGLCVSKSKTCTSPTATNTGGYPCSKKQGCGGKSKCCLGGKCMDTTYRITRGVSDMAEYRKNDCNLYKNYNGCLNCAKSNKCAGLDTNGNVICLNSMAGRAAECTVSKNHCLNPPDDTSNAGFGCPGATDTADNIAPIDPTANSGNICTYST